MCGSIGGGKTSILFNLKDYPLKYPPIPTIGFNVETIPFKSARYKDFVFWDVGGGDKIRALWHHYVQNMRGIIFVIDSTDLEQLNSPKSSPNLADSLHSLMSAPDAKDTVLLILSHKHDVYRQIEDLEAKEGHKVHGQFEDGQKQEQVEEQVKEEWEEEGEEQEQGQGQGQDQQQQEQEQEQIKHTYPPLYHIYPSKTFPKSFINSFENKTYEYTKDDRKYLIRRHPISHDEIIEQLRLRELKYRNKWKIFDTDLVNPESVNEALIWLEKELLAQDAVSNQNHN